MKRLVLVGAGHAHLGVLERLAKKPPVRTELIIIAPSSFQLYSGMVPGLIAGHYRQSQLQIDVQKLAARAGARLITDTVIGMDADRRCVCLSDGRHIEYDLLSLNVGSETDVSWLKMAGDKLLPVKPLHVFCSAWPGVLAKAAAKPGFRLVVVGGGAAGVELALAIAFVFQQQQIDADVDLVTGAHALAEHAPAVLRAAECQLRNLRIGIHALRAVGAPEGILLSDGRLLHADLVVAATGARAPCWLALSKMQLDAAGYVAVDAHHRSVTHGNVFAAGDVCSRVDARMTRSGVHAVRSGAVLAKNLLASLASRPVLENYRPRSRTLYLLACGSRHAIASWGAFSLQGRWVWYCKDWIDRRFMRRHQR